MTQEYNTALLIIAHGSRLFSSNEEIKNLTLFLDKKFKKKQNLVVKHCFLELEPPNILETITNLVEVQQIKKIYTYPYFLTAGRHVKEDIPRILDKLKKKYPQIEIVKLDYLGKSEKFYMYLSKNLEKIID